MNGALPCCLRLIRKNAPSPMTTAPAATPVAIPATDACAKRGAGAALGAAVEVALKADEDVELELVEVEKVEGVGLFVAIDVEDAEVIGSEGEGLRVGWEVEIGLLDVGMEGPEVWWLLC